MFFKRSLYFNRSISLDNICYVIINSNHPKYKEENSNNCIVDGIVLYFLSLKNPQNISHTTFIELKDKLIRNLDFC